MYSLVWACQQESISVEGPTALLPAGSQLKKLEQIWDGGNLGPGAPMWANLNRSGEGSKSTSCNMERRHAKKLKVNSCLLVK